MRRVIDDLRQGGLTQLARSTRAYMSSEIGRVAESGLGKVLESRRFVDWVGREEFIRLASTHGTCIGPLGTSNSTFLGVLPGTTIAADEAVVFAPDGRIVLESIDAGTPFLTHAVYRSIKQGDFRNLRRMLSPSVPQRQVASPTFVLCGLHSTNYHHWTCEYLPKLRMLAAYEAQTGENPNILVSKNPADWMEEGLELLGIDRGRFYEWDGVPTRAQSLLLPFHHPSRPDAFALDRGNLLWLRQKMLETVPNGSPIDSSRVLLSRERTQKRRVANRHEVEAELEGLGFETIVAEDYPLAEQIAIFRDSSMIVAPHGAGLVNMIYSPQSQIIEFMHKDAQRDHFRLLADCLGLEYDRIYGSRRGSDIVISPKEVRTLVESKESVYQA